MSTIGSINVLLSANAAVFSANLKKAGGAVGGFVGSMQSLASKVAGYGSALTALAAGAGMTALIKSSFETIDAQAKLADRMGMSTQALVGLVHAGNLAGVSQEQLTGALEKMLKTLATAATNTGPAENLARLGDELDDLAISGKGANAVLAKMGLSAGYLVNQSPVYALAAIADGLKAINNPAERASAAMSIFGKGAQGMLPLLMAGSAGLREAQEEVQKLGLAYSRIDAAKVEAANDAMTRLGTVFTGVAQTITIQLSPFIEAAAKHLTDLGSAGEGMGKRVLSAFEWVVSAVAKMTDWLELGRAGYYALRVAAAGTLAIIANALGEVIKGIEWMVKKLTGAESEIGAALVAMAENMGQQTDEAFSSMKQSWATFASGANSKAATRAFDELRSSAERQAQSVARGAAAMRGASMQVETLTEKLKEQQKIQSALADMRSGMETFGADEYEKKVQDLKAMGANAKQLGEANALAQQLRGLKDYEKAMEKVRDIYQSTRTPMETFLAGLREANDLLLSNVLDSETYSRQIQKLHADFARAELGSIKAPTAVERRFTFDVPAQPRVQDPAARLLEHQKQANDRAFRQREQTNRLLEQLGGYDVVNIGG